MSEHELLKLINNELINCVANFIEKNNYIPGSEQDAIKFTLSILVNFVGNIIVTSVESSSNYNPELSRSSSKELAESFLNNLDRWFIKYFNNSNKELQ